MLPVKLEIFEVHLVVEVVAVRSVARNQLFLDIKKVRFASRVDSALQHSATNQYDLLDRTEVKLPLQID